MGWIGFGGNKIHNPENKQIIQVISKVDQERNFRIDTDG
jgi:hypothetical protein